MKRATRRATIATALAIAILGGQHRYVLARQARAKAQYEAHRAQIDADLTRSTAGGRNPPPGSFGEAPAARCRRPRPWPFPPPPPVV